VSVATWTRRRLRFDARLNPVKSELELADDVPVSFVPMDAVGERGGLRLEEERPVDEVYNGYTYFRDGDVVIAKITPCFENGKGAIAEGLTNGVGFGTTELHVVRPCQQLDDRFLFYVTIAHDFRSFGEAEMLGAGGQKRVPERFLKDWRPPLPPLETQKRIAAFLDEKTARIDALIAKKQALLERLAEKRQAIITQAVTKGLNPAAPMKDSGIDWLGEIPAHWAVCPIKHVGRIGNGSTPSREDPNYWSDTGFPWLNSSVVNQEEVNEAEHFVTELALQECHLPIIEPPAVLVGITGQGKTRGMAAPLKFRATINQHLAFIRPETSKISAEFLLHCLQMAYPLLRFESEGAGSTKGAITCEQLGCFPIPLPAIQEQLEIVELLNVRYRRISALIEKTDCSIERLTEYRSALITAAVTGQIEELR